MISAQQAADYILWSSHESGSFISNLKLQKLLYYIQAWRLAVFNQPLFAEKFQAWVHGPVIPEIYQRYKDYRWRNIDEDVEKPTLDPSITKFMDEVLEEYGPLDARRLEYLTHREDPWKDARVDVPDDEPCSAVISEEIMGRYYRERLTDAELKSFQEFED